MVKVLADTVSANYKDVPELELEYRLINALQMFQ